METLFYRHQLTFPSALRRVARDMGWRATAWRYIARKLAAEHGSVRVWLADDTVMLFERRDSKIAVRSIKPGTWGFHAKFRWQGMTNAEHLADCERLERERKAREAR